MAYLEHVNITVADPKASARLLNDLFGWKIRWEGEAINGGYTVHVGNDESYVALYTGPGGLPDNQKLADSSYMVRGGLNHLGVVVGDIADLDKKVRSLGYTPGEHYDYEPGERFYFREENGIEIEVVSYS